MNLKQLKETRDLIEELWDFFTSNCQVDESGLVEEIAPLYDRVKGYISDGRVNIMVRNRVNYAVRKEKEKIKREKNLK